MAYPSAPALDPETSPLIKQRLAAIWMAHLMVWGEPCPYSYIITQRVWLAGAGNERGGGWRLGGMAFPLGVKLGGDLMPRKNQGLAYA